MKYNLSNIMKRAWELVKKSSMSMSDALRQAWKKVKELIIINTLKSIELTAKRVNFTIDFTTGMITGKTYQAKEFIKDNFKATWNKDMGCWFVDPESAREEIATHMHFYKTYIVTDLSAAADVIISKKLVNRADGFYSLVQYASGKREYVFVG